MFPLDYRSWVFLCFRLVDLRVRDVVTDYPKLRGSVLRTTRYCCIEVVMVARVCNIGRFLLVVLFIFDTRVSVCVQ